VEQAHESDLEGGVFIFFSDYRYKDTSCVDLRQDRRQNNACAVTIWSRLSGQSRTC
jgi:hypothetical protein